MDYLVWNEIPTALGNLVGGLAFTGLTLYTTHVRTGPKRNLPYTKTADLASSSVAEHATR